MEQYKNGNNYYCDCSFLDIKKKHLLFLCALLSAFFLQAQDYQVINYDDNNGLHNNLTKSITQDPLGFIWIATDEGLARFDGINFSAFKNGLLGAKAKAIIALKNNKIIAITELGIIEIVSKPDTTYFTPILKVSPRPSDSELYRPMGIFESSDGSLWFSGAEAIYRYGDKKLKAFTFDDKNTTSSFYRSFSIIEDAQGNLFAFSQQGFVYKYDKIIDKFTNLKNVGKLPFINGALSTQFGEIILATDDGLRILKYDKSFKLRITSYLSGIYFYCIGIDANKNIYAGSRLDGIFNIIKQNGTYQFENIPNLPEKALNNIFFDKENNIWLSTDEGIIQLNPTFFASEIKGLKQIYVSNIKKNLENTIYVSNGLSANKLYNDNNRLKANLILNKGNGDIIQFLPVDNRFLCSTFGELFWFNKGKTTKIQDASYTRDIFLMQNDSYGNIWLCTTKFDGLLKLTVDNQIIKYNSKFGNLPRRIGSLALNSNGTLYGGASGDTSYLYKYDRGIDAFKNISIPIKFEHDKKLEVHDIAILEKQIYLATSDGLLLIENGGISRFSIKGYENQNTKFVKPDKDLNLWIGYENGILKYNKNQTILFGKKDGLPANSAAYRSILIDNNNNVFIGTTGGLAYSFKNNQAPIITPSPIIISIHYNKIKSTNAASILEGSYANLSFLSLSYPSKDIKYQTKILEIDTCWSDETYGTELFIPKLKSGTYTVQIRALQHGNYLWSQPTIFSFTVLSNWYSTWWAYFGYIVLFGFIIFGIVKLNLRRLQKDNENLESIIKYRTSELVKQNKEIISQNEQINLQKNILIEQNRKIEKAYHELSIYELQLEEIVEERTKELIIAKLKAEESDRLKSSFLANLSHEIRTPLNAIIGFSDLLIEGSAEVKTQEMFKTMIQSSADSLLNLINDILDFSKIEAGVINIKKGTFRLSKILDEIREIYNIELLKFKAQFKKNFEFRIAVSAEIIHMNIYTDENRLKQILINLINNAIKFTNQGFVELGVVLLPNNEGLKFYVKDTGIGISKENQAYIFERFRKIENQASNIFRGTGIGLSICKYLSKLLGEQISVESELGKGSTFMFTIPHSTQSERIIIKDDQNSAIHIPNFKGKTILLAEDDDSNYILTEIYIKKTNANLVRAINGKEAIEIFNTNTAFDLVLLDINMPVMNGFEAMNQIRNLNPKISIVAQTAQSYQDEIDRILASGFTDYLLKPINAKKLFFILKKYLE